MSVADLGIGVIGGTATAAIFEMATTVDRAAAGIVAEHLATARTTAGASCGGNASRTTITTRSSGSGITGLTTLTGGTLITVVAHGLRPGARYLSLYYGNATCEVEAYEEDDVIGRYTPNGGGTATVTRKVDDDLDEIGSVSVRLEEGFALQACAVVSH